MIEGRHVTVETCAAVPVMCCILRRVVSMQASRSAVHARTRRMRARHCPAACLRLCPRQNGALSATVHVATHPGVHPCKSPLRIAGIVLRDHIDALLADGVTVADIAAELLSLDRDMALSMGVSPEWARPDAGGDIARALRPHHSAAGAAIGAGRGLQLFIEGASAQLASSCAAAFDDEGTWAPSSSSETSPAYKAPSIALVDIPSGRGGTQGSDAVGSLLRIAVSWASYLDSDSSRVSALSSLLGAVGECVIALPVRLLHAFMRVWASFGPVGSPHNE